MQWRSWWRWRSSSGSASPIPSSAARRSGASTPWWIWCLPRGRPPVSSLESASWAIRTATAVTRVEHVRAVRLVGPRAEDTVEAPTTSRLFLREGQMLHTLVLEQRGSILADAFLCLDEEDWILLWEGPSVEELLVHLDAVRTEVKAAEVSVVDLLASHVLWSL